MTQYQLTESVSWRDFLSVTKPKVVALMILTAVIGMLLADPGFPGWLPLIAGNLGIALVAGSGAAFNHLLDVSLDKEMSRTRHRPVAAGRLSASQCLMFALALLATGMVILFTLVNSLTAWLTLASLVGYAFIYTGFLKHATPQNIVVGGLAGAAPPLLGWTAVTGTIDAYPLLLVLIIFAWTPPHFWALAIFRVEDYRKADVPMLPVTHGVAYTRLQVQLYTLVLFAVTLLPVATGYHGWIYLIAILALNTRFLWWTVQMAGEQGHQAAWKCFKFSIKYLLWLFVALLADHYYLIPIQPI